MSTTPTLRDAAQAVLDALDECRFDIAANEALRAALTQGAGEAVEPVARLSTEEPHEIGFTPLPAANSLPPGTYDLVTAQQLQQAVARAADVCDSRAQMHSQNNDHSAANEAKKCAAAIRAKGTHD